MKILVCGSRTFSQRTAIWNTIDKYLDGIEKNECIIIQGGAKGADLIAKEYCLDNGIKCVTVEAEWDKYGMAAGPIRNQKMLDMKPDLILAFSDKSLNKSKGTRDMVARALKENIELEVVYEINPSYPHYRNPY